MEAAQTTNRLVEHIESLPKGEPFASASLLAFGPRAAVDQALSRLTKAGCIQRLARGVFVRPQMSKYVGAVPPEPMKVAKALAQAKNAQVQVHGAEAARLLGLSTQVPMQAVFQTSGPSRNVRVGGLEIKMKHVAPRKLALAGTQAGLALAALWYLGKKHVSPQVIERLERKLPEKEFTALLKAVNTMPGWMSEAIMQHQGRKARAPRNG